MGFERNSLVVAVLVLVALALSAPDATSRTWRVEKDGSGDFTVIQEAVDVAASGDTVRIGVGRFDDKRYFTCPGWTDSVRVVVHQQELTIIGSGEGTIIGQEEPWDLEQGNHKGIVAGQLAGVLENLIVRVRDIHFENMRSAIYTSYEEVSGSYVSIRYCSFHDHREALALITVDVGGEVLIEDCVFDGMARDGSQIHCWRQDKFTMRRCTSTLMYDPPMNRTHFGAWGVADLLIDDCEFIGGRMAADFFLGGPALVSNCTFTGQCFQAIAPLAGTELVIDSCIFENQKQAIDSVRDNNQVTIQRCQFLDATDCSIRLKYAGEFQAHGNDFARGERGAVHVEEINNCVEPRTLDLTDNYWGTDDPDSIAAWIHDRNDSDQVCFWIDFEPFRSESTPVESRSLADIKQLFR